MLPGWLIPLASPSPSSPETRRLRGFPAAVPGLAAPCTAPGSPGARSDAPSSATETPGHGALPPRSFLPPFALLLLPVQVRTSFLILIPSCSHSGF